MTSETLLHSDGPVTLVGGGPVSAAQLARAQALAPLTVAADGGAAAVLAAGQVPRLVIGDFDSLDKTTRAAIPEDRLHHIAEQDSTDFHKCLSRIAAPLVLAVGVSGGRMDHLLAVFNVLVRLPQRRAIVIGDEDVCVLAPPRLDLDLAPGTPVSLFPMARVSAESRGLHWPVDGLEFAPEDQSGTSNRATGPVQLVTHAPRMLLLLPLSSLEVLVGALDAAPGWS